MKLTENITLLEAKGNIAQCLCNLESSKEEKSNNNRTVLYPSVDSKRIQTHPPVS